MMPQHTPGPWRIGQLDALGGIPIVAPTPAYIVATVYVTEDINEHANARLIESSPDMAAALDAVAASPDHPELWLSQVVAAIAKAEGRA